MKFLKGNKNQKKRVLSIVGLVFLIVAVFAGIVLVQENQDIREDAAGGCKYQTDRASCEGSCVPKSNGESYKCRWGKNGCVETSNQCGGGGGGAATTCAQLSGTCMSPFSCTGRVAPTSDCTNNSERCCYAFAAPGATTHPSTCRHGDTVVQICGAGWIHGQILTPCVKKQTKVCVYGNWEVRRRCGESNPSCL